jgi:hypothetical protein
MSVDVEKIPVVFESRDNRLLNQILLFNNETHRVVPYIIKNDDNLENIKTNQAFWDDKIYLKNIVAGHTTIPVFLPVPFSIINDIKGIQNKGKTYIIVNVDWGYQKNNEKMAFEKTYGIHQALQAQHGINLDFDFITPQQQEEHYKILRESGWIQDEEGNWHFPDESGEGHIGGKSKNKKSRKNNKNRKTRTLKGGLSFSFRRAPKSTTEILTDFHKKIGNIRLKDIEPKFVSNVDKLRQRRDECIPKCLAAGEDEVTRKQMKSMMDTKSFYEWGTTCSNGFNIKKCKEFLHTYKKLDTYSKYIQGLNNNIQEHFDKITQELLNVNENRNVDKNINKNEDTTSPHLRAALVKSKSSSQSQRSRKSKSSSNSVFSPLSSSGSSDYSFRSTNSRLSAF